LAQQKTNKQTKTNKNFKIKILQNRTGILAKSHSGQMKTKDPIFFPGLKFCSR